MRHGAPGRAVVLRSEPTRLTISTAHVVYRLTLEVRFDDDTTATIVRTVTPFEVRNRHSVGDVLPVRYNPADHTDVDVDVPALRHEQEAQDQSVAERRRAAARASLADPRHAVAAGEPSGTEDDRLTGAWLEQLTRLKLGHADGTVNDSHYAAGLAAARANLRDGTAVLASSDDAGFVAAIAAAIMGDPIPGDAGDIADAERAAGLLAAIVRLKLRHEAGEIDDEQLRGAQAQLGRAIQDEAERLG